MKTKILSPTQAEDLRSGVRRNNRVASDEASGLPSHIVDELSDMLKKMGQRMALPDHPPVQMASLNELLDIVEERVIEEPPAVEVIANVGDEVEVDHDGEDVQDDFESEVEVNDVEPPPPLSLCEAREYANRLFEFVTISKDFIKRAGTSSSRDYPRDLDVLSQALANVRETSSTRQTSLLSWMSRAPSSSTGP